MMKLSSISLATIKRGLVAYKWWVIAAGSALLLLLVLAVLPLIISQQFQKWVLANGGDKVAVENIDFNPFTAKLGLYNIVIERSGNQPFLLPELQLHAQWRDLFSRRFVIRTVSVKGVHLTVDQSEVDQEHVGGILLKNLVAEEKPEPEPDAEPWTFKLNEVQLQNFNLVYKQPGLESIVDIETLTLSELDSDPQAKPAMVNFKGKMDKAPLSVNATLALFSATQNFTGKIKLTDFNLSPYLHLISTDMKHNQLVINVDSQLSFTHEKASGMSVEYDGLLSLKDIFWLDANGDAKVKELAWKGSIDAGIPVSAAMKIKTDGRLQADNLSFKGKKADLVFSNEQFLWQGKADTQYSKTQDLELVLNGQLLNRQLDLDMDAQETQVKNGNLNWQGKLDIGLRASGDWTVKSEGKLQNEMFKLDRVPQQFHLENDILAWQGNLNLGSGEDALSVQSLSDLKLSGLRMQRLEERVRLLLSESIDLEKIDVQSLDDVKVNRIAFSKFSLGKPLEDESLALDLPGFMNYENLTLDQFHYSTTQGFSINRVVQDGVRHFILRTESGEWGFGTFIGAMKRLAAKGEKEQPETDAAGDEKPLPIKIGEIVLNPVGELYYVDHSFSKPFIQKIEIDSFTATGINSKEPDKGSDLLLKARIGDAVIDVDGKASAFASDPTFDLNGEIQALSLLPYSMFIEKAMGYEVDSGSLNATTSLLAKDGNLESTTELTLHQLDIKALTKEQLKQIDGTFNAGLETGLSMLKDKHDTIKLNVPVNGSFDNLKVDPSDIINQALGAAMKKGAKTYFAAALFPFGTLLVIADAASDQAMQVQLDPVFFTAGSGNMEQKYHAYLEKIAQVLDEKPEIHVKVCGVAALEDSKFIEEQMRRAFDAQQKALADAKKLKTVQQPEAGKEKQQAEPPKPEFVVDRKKLEEQVNKLAVKRAATVTDFLLKSQDVEPKRLVHCQPRIELESAESKPRVDLLL